MTDLSRLGRAAGAGEKCAQWSSYDRASRYDEKTGKYVNWDANGDGSGIIRTEGDQSVMAEMKGPGCIWRIWSAAARQGTRARSTSTASRSRPSTCPLPTTSTASTPRSTTRRCPTTWPTSRLQRAEPLPADPLPEVVQDRGRQGLGQLLPLHLRDVSRRNRRCPRSAPQLAAEHADQLKAVDDFFAKQLGTDPAGKRRRPGDARRKSVRVAPGQTARVAKLDGPRAITALWAKTQVRRSRKTRWPACGSWPCGSPGTARRSRPSGARWATSSAPPPA